jgi:hypothetical protein
MADSNRPPVSLQEAVGVCCWAASSLSATPSPLLQPTTAQTAPHSMEPPESSPHAPTPTPAPLWPAMAPGYQQDPARHLATLQSWAGSQRFTWCTAMQWMVATPAQRTTRPSGTSQPARPQRLALLTVLVHGSWLCLAMPAVVGQVTSQCNSWSPLLLSTEARPA